MTYKYGNYYSFAQDILNGKNHVLIAGATGSGKSVLLNCLLWSAIGYSTPFADNSGIQFILLDPKKVELIDYKSLPHTIAYADDTQRMTQALRLACDIIDRRYLEMQSQRIKTYQGSAIYIVIDELADLLLSENKSEITKMLQHIAQVGRACKVLLLACTQAPNRHILRSEIVLNIGCRIALRTNSNIESRQIIGCAGAELLSIGHGIIQIGLDKWMQDIPFVPDTDIRKRIDDITQPQTQAHAYLKRIK